MSDARPITTITGFVCGSCWNSFSKDDPGVIHGSQVICPFCGNVLPGDGQDGGDIASAVRAAPAFKPRDSDSYPAMSAVSLDVAPGFPSLDDPPLGWLPPDDPPARVTAPRSASAGFVAGAQDGDDLGGATLRPDDSHERLMELVRNAPARMDSSAQDWPADAASRGYVAGDEMPVDIDERTPVDGEERAANMLGADQDEESGFSPDLPSDEAGLSEAEQMTLRDWKLKAMGLTYNFHGLDALLGWASNKAGQTLSVSNDGVTWKDFSDFFEAIKSGAPANIAFEQAAEPGAAPRYDTASRMGRSTSSIKGIHAPDLQIGQAPEVEAEAAVPAATEVSPARTPSGMGRSTSATGSMLPASGPSSSRRLPTAAPTAKASSSAMPPLRVALAVVLVVVTIGAVLHQLGVFN